MKKTFKELLEADAVVGKMYIVTPELKESKFGYAWKRFYEKNIQKTMNEYREQMIDCYIQNALEKDGRIVTDKDSARGYGYSKQGLLDCIKAEKVIEEKFDAIEIEVLPHIVSESSFPQSITDYEREILTGLVL